MERRAGGGGSRPAAVTTSQPPVEREEGPPRLLHADEHRRPAQVILSLHRGVASAALPARDADADAAGRHLAVLLLADEVQLGGPDVGVAGELAHLVPLRPVADGVVDGRLAQRVHAYAAPAQAVGVDA